MDRYTRERKRAFELDTPAMCICMYICILYIHESMYIPISIYLYMYIYPSIDVCVFEMVYLLNAP